MTKGWLDYIRVQARFLYRPYGRALFYFYVGNMVCCTSTFLTASFFVGIWTSIVGALVFYASRNAAVQARALKAANFDEGLLRRKFEQADGDHNGTLDTAELSRLCADLGCALTRNELEAALVVLDADGDGNISFPEFLSWYTSKNDDLDI